MRVIVNKSQSRSDYRSFMQNAPPDYAVFERARVRHNRERARAGFEDFAFIHNWARDVMADRLYDINRIFDTAVQIGSRGGFVDATHPKIRSLFTMDLTSHPVAKCALPYFAADEEFLPLKKSSLDAVFSTLTLQSTNDLPGALIQIRQSLKADGLFLACLFGGETLYELRDVMMRAELELYGGVSPRIYPFADKPQMGDLLQRAGFSLPVVDSEILRVSYDNAFKLFADLRGMGEGNAIARRDKAAPSRDFFMRVAQLYQEAYAFDKGRIQASFEIIFVLGWAPHESQQKPLRPGSAKMRLADALGSEERTAGEKARPDD